MLPLRLFRNPVFRVSAAISLAAGFALFGSISFLPLFLQVVHGVSPTLSGVYLLPMVGGLLITSITSGQLIARTGRYKIYPIIGTGGARGGAGCRDGTPRSRLAQRLIIR